MGAEGEGDVEIAPSFGIGRLSVRLKNVPEKIGSGLLCSIYFNWLRKEPEKKNVTNRFGEVVMNCIYFEKDHIFAWLSS